MTKVISLSDDAYEALKRMKDGDESFSGVVMKLAEKEKKSGVMKFAGAWKNNPEMEKIFAEIRKDRKNFRMKGAKF